MGRGCSVFSEDSDFFVSSLSTKNILDGDSKKMEEKLVLSVSHCKLAVSCIVDPPLTLKKVSSLANVNHKPHAVFFFSP